MNIYIIWLLIKMLVGLSVVGGLMYYTRLCESVTEVVMFISAGMIGAIILISINIITAGGI